MFTHPQLKLNIKNLGLFFRKFSENKLKEKLAEFFSNQNIIFTDSGRSAFILAIEHLNLQNSEMLIPAYICNIFLPILKHYNIKPIFLDIDLRTFNVIISEIEQKMTPKTKSILVCHTYGLLNDMDKILEIARKYNLKIIEDCAHIFPKKLQGDCAFFSLPKFLPVVNGGMLICKNLIEVGLKKTKFKISDLIKFLRLFPFLTTFSEKFRRSYEKTNRFIEPKKPFNCSLRILSWHLDNLENQTKKRTELAKYFQEQLQKIGFQVSPGTTFISALAPENINRDELFNKLRKKNIFCSRIWHQPIILDKEKYPNSYETAQRIINFPLQNWFMEKNIDKMVKCLIASLG